MLIVLFDVDVLPLMDDELEVYLHVWQLFHPLE